MTTYLAFSEIEAVDIINTGVTVVTSGVCVETNVNRAAIQMYGGAIVEATLPTPINEGWVHVRMRPRNGSSTAGAFADYMFGLVDETNAIIGGFYDNRTSSGGSTHTPQLRAVIFSDPSIGSNNTDTTGTLILTPDGSAYLFDIHFKIDNSVGFFRWYLDGTLVREVIGDTQRSASAAVSKLRFRALGPNTNTSNFAILQISQVLVSDITTINARVHTIPLSAGSINQWSGNIADVVGSEVSPSTIMQESTIGERILFATTNSSASILEGNEIKDVIISQAGLRVDGSVINRIRGKALVGGTEYNSSSTIALTSGYKLGQVSFPLNPATGSQWTLSDINSAELGIQAEA